MRLVRRPLVAALVAWSLVLAVPAIASKAGTPHVTVARHRDGPFHHRPLDVSVRYGESKALFVKVTNTTPHEVTQYVTLTQVASGDVPGYRVLWLKGLSGSKDISRAVMGTGYAFLLEPGVRRGFTVRVRNLKKRSNQFCLRGTFHAEPHGLEAGADFRVNGRGLCVLPAIG